MCIYAKLFESCLTLRDPRLLSMGFSRQEYWSGLPCPSPGDLPNPGIKLTSLVFPALAGGLFITSTTWKTWQKTVWKWEVKVLIVQSCPTLCDPMDCSLPGPSVHGILQARILEWAGIPFFRGIFLTQGSNPGLLHCRQIIYCLSHQGSPIV